MRLETPSLILLLETPEDLRARIDQMPAREKAQISPAWLALVLEAPAADPWIHGFNILSRATGTVIGSCGFKGPPGADQTAEIAYMIIPECEGRGFATEAAQALVQFAAGSGRVSRLRAHTLPEANASGRVLSKCGFQHVGEVIDPEDGRVWRWEKTLIPRADAPSLAPVEK